jgi:hypothetical protein
MISGIIPGQGITVSGAYGGALPYINSNSSNPMQGMLRVNGSSMQVFDGSSWLNIGSQLPTVELNGAAMSAINWAQIKMAEEAELQELAKKHPAVADALNAVNEAHNKLKVLVALTQEENK